jgi:nitroimidazol reductase NimA-like FMN-containing flavoprotein (pyridoxamine 5'-phosphate oxidase superfamily)
MSKPDDIPGLKKTIVELFSTQMLAVLSTHGNKQSYASLVAFAATDDLKHIIFATTRSTRKYANLSSEPNVALLIDNRANEEKDFSYAVAATALGRADEVSGSRKGAWRDIYLTKHPHLREFVSSPSCALMKVRVKKYYIVNRFQNVQELHLP